MKVTSRDKEGGIAVLPEEVLPDKLNGMFGCDPSTTMMCVHWVRLDVQRRLDELYYLTLKCKHGRYCGYQPLQADTDTCAHIDYVAAKVTPHRTGH
jgi:hypothetical protein